MRPRRLAVWAALAAAIGFGTWHWSPPTVAAPAPATNRRAATRVVSGSPALTELIFAIGGGSRLVGVSEFCTYPPEAKQIPTIGAILHPNLEELTRLRPDLVLFQGEHAKLREYCAGHHQSFLAFKLDSVADVLAAVDRLGDELGLQAPARAVSQRLHGELDQVRRAVAGQPATRVFVSLGGSAGGLDRLVTCGPHTFLHELVTLAGGANVFADVTELYPAPSLEVLTARAPEMILDLQPGAPADPEARTRLRDQWRKLPTLPAVRSGRIELVTEDYAMIPATRMGLLAKRLALALHPERAKLLQE